jgi:hypothetical protein
MVPRKPDLRIANFSANSECKKQGSKWNQKIGIGSPKWSHDNVVVNPRGGAVNDVVSRCLQSV